MSINKIILPTSALLTAMGAAAFPAVVSAQDASNPLTLSFEGAVGTGDHSNAYGEAKLGSGFDAFDDDVAFVGSVGLSRAINDNWDWSLSVSRLEYADNSDGTFGGDSDVLASTTTKSNRSEAKFTVGRDLTIGSASARLGLGLAYAKASSEKGLNVADINYSLDSATGSEFQGIGPHISLDLESAPVSADGKLSIIGGVEASLMAGQYQNSKGFEAYDGIGSSPTFDNQNTSTGKMMTAGVKIGIKYSANESTAFRAGVRFDETRMDDAEADNNFGFDVNDSRTSFFVGMDVSF